MDAFLFSTTWHYMLFAKTAAGDFWRVWFEGDPFPYQQRLIGNESEFAEPLAALRKLEDEARAAALKAGE